MKVCFFQGGFAANGGIGRVVSVLSGALAERGIDVYLCAFFERKADAYYEISPLCKRTELFGEPISMSKAMIRGRAVKKLTKYIKDNGIDIIIACGALYYPLCTLAAKKAGIKLVCWEHINPKIKNDYKFQDASRKFGAKRSSCNVLLTRSALEIYNRRFKGKNNVQIYNPIDPTLLSKESDYNTNSKAIVSIGRLCYQKNFSRLLDIAAEILPKYTEWSWDVYGEGDLRQELIQKCDSLGLSDRVRFLGHVGDLYDRYKNYAFTVMTSRYEGFPMTLLEGAASGLPMVSFDIETGPSEIIVNGINGFLAGDENNKDIITAIESLIESSNLREKMSAQAKITAAYFSISNITDNWMDILNSL